MAGQPATAHPRVFDGASFWSNLATFTSLPKAFPSPDVPPTSIGVIGTGETAAAIVVALAELLKDKALIEVITSHGVLFSRDEGYQENHVFSDPDALWIDTTKRHKRTLRDSSMQDCPTHHFKWASLTEADRREFMARTDRGVFSMQAMQAVNLADNVSPLTGTAKHLSPLGEHNEAIQVTIEYDGKVREVSYDYVVVAIGFNPLWFTDLFDESLASQMRTTLGELRQSAFEREIGYDLSVQNWPTRLHLPMLAGVAQGPGFPNLSCLGLLSDRVLKPYVHQSV